MYMYNVYDVWSLESLTEDDALIGVFENENTAKEFAEHYKPTPLTAYIIVITDDKRHIKYMHENTKRMGFG